MPNFPETQNKGIELTLSIQIVKQNGKPAIQLRKIICDKKTIKLICEKALKDQGLPARIEIKDKFYATTRLKAAGLI